MQAPGPAGPDRQILTTRYEEEFLSRFGDVIDDRIAEILDELLEERMTARPHRRLPLVLGTVGLILGLTSVLLRYNAPVAWTIWPATAAICLTWAIRSAGAGRRAWPHIGDKPRPSRRCDNAVVRARHRCPAPGNTGDVGGRAGLGMIVDSCLVLNQVTVHDRRSGPGSSHQQSPQPR